MLKTGVDIPSCPYSVGWFVTNACNYRCRHCNMSSGDRDGEELSGEEARFVVRKLAQKSIHSLFFTGGEPFVRNDFEEIANEAIASGIHVHVTTNASLLDEDMIRRHLMKYSSVRVSLDSCFSERHDWWRRQPGAYAKALKVIQLLVQYRVNVAVSMCVSKWNVAEIPNMMDLLAKIDVHELTLPLFAPEGRGREIADLSLSPQEVRALIIHLRDWRRRYPMVSVRTDIPYSVLMPDPLVPTRNYPCAAAKTEMTVFANGDISPCFALPIKCGNILADDIEDVWNANRVFAMFRDASLVEGRCSVCEHLSVCGGGCRALTFLQTGSLVAEDPSCWKK